MKLKTIPAIILVLVCFITFSSCSLFGGTDEKKITAYLKAVGPDFEKSKDDLKVFDGELDDDIDALNNVLEMVKKSKSDFQMRMESAKKQEVPENPKEIKDFHSSLLKYYTDSIKIIGEMEQILNYAGELYKSLEPIINTATTDLGRAPSLEEVKIVVKNLKSSVDQSIDIVEKSTPPQYMANSHENYLSILKSYSIAADDFVYALQIQDPLRTNATAYRFELLSIKLQHVGDEMEAEIEQQQKKINSMGAELQKNQDDLYKQLLIWQGQYKAAD